jgi:hypothetical protein
VVPPVNLITKVLNYMSTQTMVATLIVPAWPSASFWPLLAWQRYVSHINDYRYYKGNGCCCHGRNTSSLLGSNKWKGYLIALRLLFL